ncbi:type II toxin-antitoxin system PemK/MazF family toxin [Candidatus Acetothermia bacterium]|nr:type II toxin-antitoxin system PemK/MazF family toxin [Candidatus Acetothermia bacterium]MBI3660710.1 type II toxin-antitoxin system PemK/MazF family toxin [Candidatus Acetothermia bacterium]
MTNYQPGDLVLVAFPYARGAQTKNRPALVLLDTGNSDIVVARVTTQMHQTPYDVLITNWQGTGLLAPSVVRLHKLATLEKVLVRNRLGNLQPADRQQVSAVMQQIYRQW